MIRVLNISIYKFFLYGILVFLTLTLFSSITFAQESDDTVTKKYGITFPISELGNCGSISECKSYCDNENNRDACVNFAKKKGFHKENSSNNNSMLKDAQSSLGCSSENSCRAFCEQESNRQKCMEFAKRHGVKTGPSNEIMNRAKSELGCNSPESCRVVCEQEANREKCSNFAKSVGLSGGEHRVGPGGCTSEESCRAYCEKNPNECGGTGTPNGTHERREGFEGPRNEQEDFCRRHPEECAKKFNQVPLHNYTPEVEQSIQPRDGQLPASEYEKREYQPPTEGSYTRPPEMTTTEGETRNVQGISTKSLIQKIKRIPLLSSQG